MDILLPHTDAGVAAQGAVAFGVLVSLFFAVRRNRELRRFVTGLAVMTLALFGLRAIH